MAHSSERDIALAAESVLRNFDPVVLPAAIWVQCADREVTLRLTGYLTGVQEEMITA
ncbi:hypothetical protein [Methylobacterium durans]|uniref:hypothetical protein n=1 Tax=Methylobacterium durans TaxID=2202825 RepID=UPI001F3A3126|nr:hypothetical protein [Methylobacterium durans]